MTREILPASTQCPCCSREMARIGQDESKQLHLVPAHAEVHVTVRPKFACRACGELAQAPAPDDRPIERGLPTAGTIAQVVIAKYLNHMPLHRQAAHYARLGVLLATTTLYGWVEAAARDLAPVADRLLELLLRRTKIHADDTPVTVLNPGRSGTHDGRFWVYADDTRPRGGSEPSIAVFRFSAGRAGKHPGQHLAGFNGTLQADAFSGFDHLYRGGAMVEAGCLGHARRKLVDLVRAKGSPVAAEGVKQIAALYRIERRIYGLPPAERLAVRQSEAVPLLDALRAWLTERLSQVAPRSELAKALGYMNAQWDALVRYAADGTLEIDNLTAERALRGIAIGPEKLERDRLGCRRQGRRRDLQPGGNLPLERHQPGSLPDRRHRPDRTDQDPGARYPAAVQLATARRRQPRRSGPHDHRPSHRCRRLIRPRRGLHPSANPPAAHHREFTRVTALE